MGKHTPGTWKTFNATDVYPDDDDLSASRHIADCSMESSLSMDERIANARLIAAAPDLLEALKQCREYLKFSLGSASQINPYPVMDAAIARAEGKD